MPIHSWLPHGALNGSNGWTHALEAREFANDTAIWGIVTAHPPMEGQEVDWKQFALLGSSDLEPYAILLVRVSLGLFFAISGANKLFVAGSTQTMYETLVEAKVPFSHLMTYFVSGVEFVGGSLLTVGFLSSLACVALLVDMLVAILTTKFSAMPKGLSPLNWLDDFLYLPEVLYVLFFIWLICSGPGKFSVDYWLAGKLRR
ncbi:MAG: DoxX family protein [Candidatus Acidiferrum sp.]